MAGQLTIDTLKASSGVLATQNGMTGIAKAWVSFNGSTLAIANSFNVTSVTKSATGDYNINFTTAMTSNAYSAVGTGHNPGADVVIINFTATLAARTTTSLRITAYKTSTATVDATVIDAAVIAS